MAYTRINYKSKAQVKRALSAGVIIDVYQPGPFGPNLPNGWHSFEGPHYPEPHRWYGKGRVENGILKEIK